MKFSHLPMENIEVEYKLVGFVIGQVRYGVDIMQVREIMHPVEFLSVPAGPPYVVGVADHRDEVVPIVDLRIRFGLPPEEVTSRSKWVLVNKNGKTAALLVDRVTEVIKITSENRRDRHSLLAQEENPWVGDVYADNDGLIFELELNAVFGRMNFLASDQKK